MDRTEVTADTAKQQLIMENFRRTHDTSLTFQHTEGQLRDDRPGLHIYLMSVTIKYGGRFGTAAPVVLIPGQSNTYRDNEGNVPVKCKKIEPSSNYAEWVQFKLMYIGTYVSERRGKGGGTSSDSGSVTEGFQSYCKISSGEVSKRRIYTDNIILESGGAHW